MSLSHKGSAEFHFATSQLILAADWASVPTKANNIASLQHGFPTSALAAWSMGQALIWEDICRWLREDAWVEQQLASEQSQDENTQKLVRLQQFKISQARAKLTKVREGFEGGIYSLDEAKRRIVDLQTAIAKTEGEIERLQQSTKASTSNKADTDAVRQKLKALRDRNLDKASVLSLKFANESSFWLKPESRYSCFPVGFRSRSGMMANY